MNNINEKTEELIDLYLKYSSNKNIKADEFLMLRKQAIKECKKENLPFHSNVIRPLNSESYNPVNLELNKEIEVHKDTKKENIPIKEKSLFKKDINNEEMFLNMIKDIQD